MYLRIFYVFVRDDRISFEDLESETETIKRKINRNKFGLR